MDSINEKPLRGRYYFFILVLIWGWLPTYLMALNNGGYGGRPMHLPIIYLVMTIILIAWLVQMCFHFKM